MCPRNSLVRLASHASAGLVRESVHYVLAGTGADMTERSPQKKEREGFFADFDRLGEDHVRLWLNGPETGSSVHYRQRRAFAIEWLAQFERTTRLEAEAERAENKRTARSAKNAAWAAAIAAIIAAVAAIASAVIVFWPRS